MTMRLNEKVALVTSSRQGICADTAKQLAGAGARVMICGRNAAQGRDTVAQIQQQGGRASFILTDVAIAADVQAAIDETIATYGRLDILFNSIGGPYPLDGPLLDVSETTWDRITETTLKGTFLCCQYALPFLQNAGQVGSNSTIINLIEQSESVRNRSVTEICQGGILAMTHEIAQQLSGSNVSANLIWSGHQPQRLNRTILSLLTDQVLYGPARPDEPAQAESSQSAAVPFANSAEAIMYLATEGRTLHGCALVVDSSASEN
ncbi:MAG: SDR family oxidoreductase [Cyanobacteria bacterium J06606_4]